jgi:hypothetical protein
MHRRLRVVEFVINNNISIIPKDAQGHEELLTISRPDWQISRPDLPRLTLRKDAQCHESQLVQFSRPDGKARSMVKHFSERNAIGIALNRRNVRNVRHVRNLRTQSRAQRNQTTNERIPTQEIQMKIKSSAKMLFFHGESFLKIFG